MSKSDGMLQQAIEWHRQGRLIEAAAAYRQLLQREPRQPDALHLLGVTEAQAGRMPQAAEFITAALEVQPDNAVARNNLGNALAAMQRHAEALANYERALLLQPDYVDARYNFGGVLARLQRYAEALSAYDRVLVSRPQVAEVHSHRGACLSGLGLNEEAARSCERALALRPDFVPAYYNRGVALGNLQRHAEALACYEQALALDSQFTEAHNNRGIMLQALGQPAAALGSFERAVALRPDFAEAHANRGGALNCLGRYQEALASYDVALALNPQHPGASWNKATVKLLLGELCAAWPLYESRFAVKELGLERRSFASPRWDGSQGLAGKKILVHAEQGLGDTLQFSRYAGLLRTRGAQVILEVPPALKALLGSLDGVRVIARGEDVAVDFHCALQSLPAAFGTELSTIPNAVPYLAANAQHVKTWASRVAAIGKLKVGIAWQGNLAAEKYALRGRSIPLQAFEGLANINGVGLVSLQKGPGAEQLAAVRFREQITTFDQGLDNGPDAFVDTAALMMNLDLVVTCDTAIAHLAGALGVTVWVALHHTPEWRWLLDRMDSPWYPTMRLFRQRQAGHWGEVFNEIGCELAAFAATGSPA